jgi:mRNA interferase YafQ
MYRDMKRMAKRGKDMRKLLEVIDLLSTGNPLPTRYRDHALTGNRKGYRDCHIESDWLLIYKVVNDALIIVAAETGTHSDLFG